MIIPRNEITISPKSPSLFTYLHSEILKKRKRKRKKICGKIMTCFNDDETKTAESMIRMTFTEGTDKEWPKHLKEPSSRAPSSRKISRPENTRVINENPLHLELLLVLLDRNLHMEHDI